MSKQNADNGEFKDRFNRVLNRIKIGCQLTSASQQWDPCGNSGSKLARLVDNLNFYQPQSLEYRSIVSDHRSNEKVNRSHKWIKGQRSLKRPSYLPRRPFQLPPLDKPVPYAPQKIPKFDDNKKTHCLLDKAYEKVKYFTPKCICLDRTVKVMKENKRDDDELGGYKPRWMWNLRSTDSVSVDDDDSSNGITARPSDEDFKNFFKRSTESMIQRTEFDLNYVLSKKEVRTAKGFHRTAGLLRRPLKPSEFNLTKEKGHDFIYTHSKQVKDFPSQVPLLEDVYSGDEALFPLVAVPRRDLDRMNMIFIRKHPEKKKFLWMKSMQMAIIYQRSYNWFKSLSIRRGKSFLKEVSHENLVNHDHSTENLSFNQQSESDLVLQVSSFDSWVPLKPSLTDSEDTEENLSMKMSDYYNASTSSIDVASDATGNSTPQATDNTSSKEDVGKPKTFYQVAHMVKTAIRLNKMGEARLKFKENVVKAKTVFPARRLRKGALQISRRPMLHQIPELKERVEEEDSSGSSQLSDLTSEIYGDFSLNGDKPTVTSNRRAELNIRMPANDRVSYTSLL